MNNITAFSGLDDEEDLEALRLIALQSLKKNAPLPDGSTLQTYPQQSPEHPTQFWQNKGFRNKKGKAFGVQYSNRGNRTGHFNTHFNRVRSTNLISIPTLPADTESDDKPSTNEVKLNLPQNRYCINDDGDKSQDSSSKFDRYNNSDKSESESEDETDVLLSDEEGPPLKKSNSLEALMQELDKEIEGKVAEEKTKTKKTKKRKKETSTSDTPNEGVENAVDETDKPKNTNDSAPIVSEIPKEPVTSIEEETQQVQNEYGSPMKKRLRPGSPNRRNFYNRRRQRNYQMQQQNNPPVMMPYGPGPVQYPPQMLPFNGQPFNPMYGPPGMMPNQPIPPYFENSLPPLTINTEPLPGPTLAPLSPRSAAFVMENKAIIERRRRSPRRSYSRSPSRSPTRSLTPRRSPRWSISPRRSPVRRLPPRKRSLTPKRKSISPRKKSLTPRRKSVSPRRLSSPSRRKSLSPKRKSLSPRRRSVSPRRRSLTPRRQSPLPRSPNRKKSVSPKRKAGDGGSSRAPVRDRLGVKSKTDEKEKPKQTEEPVKKDDKPLDPILEARKRKFESNEIKMKEGIIRLRPKDEKPKDDAPKEEKPIEIKQKETKPNSNKTKEERPKVDKPKEEPVKPEKPKPQIDIKIEKTETEPRSTTPKPKESIVEVAPATTTTTEDKQIDVPDEFKELEKLLLGGDDLELVPKVEDIFSDEDSASDNEGRFKVKEQKTGAKPPVISFSKLVNGEKREIKSEPLAKYTKNRDGRERSDRDRLSHRSRTNLNERRERKEPAIFPEKEKKKSPEKTIVKSLAKHRAPFRTERPPPVMDKRFERKIEIKIKNPSKYERSGKSKIVSKNEVASSSSSSTIDRKISVEERMSDSTVEEDDEETEPEMIVDNGSDEEYSNFNEGDLRAQLSKKRAEKLHKIPVEQVSKRLLDYALKGAVYKKSKKKSKDKDIIICDGKPPIHLRLGTGNELYPELRVKRKSRKRKNREILEQLEYHVIEK